MNASKISIVPILQAGDQPADLNQAAEDGEEAARRRSRTSRCVTCYSEAVDFRAARKLAQVRKVLYIFKSPPLQVAVLRIHIYYYADLGSKKCPYVSGSEEVNTK